MDLELILIEKVMVVQAERMEYYRLKRLYGNASQQLKKCKDLEAELKKYCYARLKEKQSDQSKPKVVQHQLFIS